MSRQKKKDAKQKQNTWNNEPYAILRLEDVDSGQFWPLKELPP
jgi:hypothetical protein